MSSDERYFKTKHHLIQVIKKFVRRLTFFFLMFQIEQSLKSFSVAWLVVKRRRGRNGKRRSNHSLYLRKALSLTLRSPINGNGTFSYQRKRKYFKKHGEKHALQKKKT